MTRLIYMPGVCRECGCTDESPCDGGCVWVEDDLCSACAPDDEDQGEPDFNDLIEPLGGES